jgi:hypothetical protein
MCGDGLWPVLADGARHPISKVHCGSQSECLGKRTPDRFPAAKIRRVTEATSQTTADFDLREF